jgi:hypothetical protein
MPDYSDIMNVLDAPVSVKKLLIFSKKTLVKFFTMRQLFRAFNGTVGIDGE